MIRKGIRLRRFCCEDLNNIENYEQAVNSPERWDCHHKLEIELNKSKQELIDLDLYYNRPANELIFLTHSEHQSMHMKILWKQRKLHSNTF